MVSSQYFAMVDDIAAVKRQLKMAPTTTEVYFLLLLSSLFLPGRVSVAAALTSTEEAGSVKSPEIKQVNMSMLCECNQKLIPEIKSTNDLLGFLLVVVEEAQGNAALSVAIRQEARSGVPADSFPEAIPSFSQLMADHPLGGPLFLQDMSTLLTSIEELQSSISQTGIVNEVTGIRRSAAGLPNGGLCPQEYVVQTYKNLTSMLTNAVHYRENVKSDANLASNTLIEVRKTVISMKEKLGVFGQLLKEMESSPCPKAEDRTQGRSVDGSSAGDYQPVDCPCAEKLLPELRNLTDLMEWVLQIMRETQARAAWTVKVASKTPDGERQFGRSAERISYRFIRAFGDPEPSVEKSPRPDHRSDKGLFVGSLPVIDIYSKFTSKTMRPLKIVTSGSSNSSEVECPMSHLLELRQSLVSRLTDALHYREYVKEDPDFADHLFGILTKGIETVEKTLKVYRQNSRDLENSSCNLQARVYNLN